MLVVDLGKAKAARPHSASPRLEKFCDIPDNRTLGTYTWNIGSR